MKKIFIAIAVIAIVLIGLYLFNQKSPDGAVLNDISGTVVIEKPVTATTTDQKKSAEFTIGKSVGNRDIVAFNFGKGDKELLFIGGIHGGYSWNTVSVAYEFIDYLKQNPNIIPANIQITVIPVLNPDGLYKVTNKIGKITAADVSKSQIDLVAGRFNANDVDLNRNFDCVWQASGKWQDKTVSGGARAFSEPESIALRTYVQNNKPIAVVAWYSAAGGVFASSCNNGVSLETNTLTKKYSDASGYPAHQEFDFYELTGDMVNWFAKNNIPAISVLLTNHTDTEWAKNRAGINALLTHYGQ